MVKSIFVGLVICLVCVGSSFATDHAQRVRVVERVVVPHVQRVEVREAPHVVVERVIQQQYVPQRVIVQQQNVVDYYGNVQQIQVERVQRVVQVQKVQKSVQKSRSGGLFSGRLFSR